MTTEPHLQRDIAAPSDKAVAAAGRILHLSADRERVPAALAEIAAVNGAAGARIWWRVRSEFPVTHWASYRAAPAPVAAFPATTGAWSGIWDGTVHSLRTHAGELPKDALPGCNERAVVDAWALIPSGTRARGVVLFWWDGDPGSLSEADGELLREALSACVAQIWWRERWAQRNLERELLDETGRLLARSLDREEIIGGIFELLRRVVHYDAGGIFLVDPGAGEVAQVFETGYGSEAREHLHLKIGQGLVGHVAKTGEAVIVADVAADQRYVNARPRTRSALVVPMESRGRRLGVLNLENDRLAAYDPGDQRLVEAFAQQVAMALDRARLFERAIVARQLTEQLDAARTIQRSFLPQRPPSVEGYEIAGVNYPSEEVGGDYFDFVPIVDGQWGIAIADVSGKGIPGALVMAGFRASMIAEIRNNYAIRTIFRKVSNVMREMTPPDIFITAFYGVLDVRNRVFTFTNAGHNRPFLLRASGAVERLTEGGPLVGVIHDAKYEERPIWFGPGDLLLLFTDGVTESRSPAGDEFGETRLLELLQEIRTQPAAEICTRIHEKIRDFVGSEAIADDITLIVVKAR